MHDSCAHPGGNCFFPRMKQICQISCDYCCATFVSLFINLRHPRISSHTHSEGEPCTYINIIYRRGDGGAYSFVARLSHLTTDHASLSRRSIVPTPDRDIQHLGAHYVFAMYYFEVYVFCLSYPLPVSPSVATIYLLA